MKILKYATLFILFPVLYSCSESTNSDTAQEKTIKNKPVVDSTSQKVKAVVNEAKNEVKELVKADSLYFPLFTDSSKLADFANENYSFLGDSPIEIKIDDVKNLYDLAKNSEETKLTKSTLKDYIYLNSMSEEELEEYRNVEDFNTYIDEVEIFYQGNLKVNDSTDLAVYWGRLTTSTSHGTVQWVSVRFASLNVNQSPKKIIELGSFNQSGAEMMSRIVSGTSELNQDMSFFISTKTLETEEDMDTGDLEIIVEKEERKSFRVSQSGLTELN